jgi:hypothetical protein
MSAESMDGFIDRKLDELRVSHWNRSRDLVAALRPVAEDGGWSTGRTFDEIGRLFEAFRDDKPYEPRP